MLSMHESNLGDFQECDYGNYFTYRFTDNPWALLNGLMHEIDVGDGVRFARVLKTVVHLCIDEDIDGKAVIEKWQIKNHNNYVRK